MKKKIKTTVLFLFSFLALISTLYQPVKTTQAFDWDPEKWILCSLDSGGKAMLKAKRTEWVSFLLRGKSFIGNSDSENNIFNSLLSAAGYTFTQGDEQTTKNAFEVFGLSGLNFSSYGGEWKYFEVDPCQTGNRRQPKSTNFGQYYETRKEPLSNNSEASSSIDIRTIEYNKGTMSAFGKAFSDNVSNIFLYIAKFLVSITLAIISVSFSDLSSLIGIGENLVVQLYKNIFLPFSYVMFLATALYIGYYGLIKREYRTALVNGLAKTILAYGLAVILATVPSLTKVPNQIVTMGQALVLSSMTSTITNDGEQSLCDTTTGIYNINENTSMEKTMNNTRNYIRSVVGCRLWSEFLFKPYIKGQFGTDYENLTNINNENEEWVGKPIVQLSSRTIENWGLFHISVMSGKHKPVDNIPSPNINGVNKDYYRIVDALSNYNEEEIEFEKPIGDDSITYTSYPEVLKTTPTEYWEYWNGSNSTYRIQYSILIFGLSVLGSIMPLLFAIAGATYSIGLNILTKLAPIFLLFGCYGGRGNQILMQYFGTIISTIIKAIVTTVLLIFSIIIVTNTMSLINEIGIFQAFVFFAIIVFVLYRQKDTIINKLSQVNLGQLNLQGFYKGLNNLKKTRKLAVDSAMFAGLGAYTAHKSGGSPTKGAQAAMSSFLRNKMYQTRMGRIANMTYEATNRHLSQLDTKNCVSCGVLLKEGEFAFVDIEGNYYCDTCASVENYEDMTQVLLDNQDENSIKVTKTEKRNVLSDDEDDKLDTIHHPTLFDINKQNINTANSESWNAEKKILAQKTALNSMKIIRQDMEKVNAVDGGIIGDSYVPEPIRALVDYKKLSNVVKTSNTKEYEEIMQEGWEKWYTSLAVQHNESNDVALEEIKSTLENKTKENTENENNGQNQE